MREVIAFALIALSMFLVSYLLDRDATRRDAARSAVQPVAKECRCPGGCDCKGECECVVLP